MAKQATNLSQYIFCRDEDDFGTIYGPLEPEEVQPWLKQHNNDIPEGTPDDSPMWMDYNHYCTNIQTLAGDFNEQHHFLSGKIGIKEVTLDAAVS